jgi:hypothetical protein
MSNYNAEHLRRIPWGFSSPTLILVSPDLKIPPSWESHPMVTLISVFGLNIRNGGTLLLDQIEHVVKHAQIERILLVTQFPCQLHQHILSSEIYDAGLMEDLALTKLVLENGKFHFHDHLKQAIAYLELQADHLRASLTIARPGQPNRPAIDVILIESKSFHDQSTVQQKPIS